MADSTEGDTNVQYLGLLVPALIALIAGLVIHLFIIGVNVTDWWKGRSVTPVDLIVTSLGISRMCAQCVSNIYVFKATLFLMKNLDSNVTLFIMDVVYDFSTYVNIWLTSLLSIVLCLKISNLHSRLFLYLRGVVEHRTVYFIVGSVLLSASSCLIPLLMSITELTKSGTYNTTMDNLFRVGHSIHFFYFLTIGEIFPLLFYCISSVLLFSSLYHHMIKMKMSSNLSINLETYYSVMKYIAFTFIYNILYFLVDFIGIFYYYIYCVYLGWLLIVLEFLPVLHSSYLIYRTAKLRSQMAKVLQDVTDVLFCNKNAETRENI